MLDPRRAILALSRTPFDDPSGRPRELFTGLARERQVIYVEEPVAAEAGVPDSWELQFPGPHLLVARPALRAAASGFAGAPHPQVASMLVQLLRWQDVEDVVAWLDTPHALPIARALGARLLVYDRPSAAAPAQGGEDGRGVAVDPELARAADLVVVAEPVEGPHRWRRTAARALADLEEAERRPCLLRRRHALRAPGQRAARGGR